MLLLLRHFQRRHSQGLLPLCVSTALWGFSSAGHSVSWTPVRCGLCALVLHPLLATSERNEAELDVSLCSFPGCSACRLEGDLSAWHPLQSVYFCGTGYMAWQVSGGELSGLIIQLLELITFLLSFPRFWSRGEFYWWALCPHNIPLWP